MITVCRSRQQTWTTKSRNWLNKVFLMLRKDYYRNNKIIQARSYEKSNNLKAKWSIKKNLPIRNQIVINKEEICKNDRGKRKYHLYVTCLDINDSLWISILQINTIKNRE